jgi:hypothetical protein
MAEASTRVGEISQDLNSYIQLYNLMKSILHYPQLDTVLMVEEFIRKHSGELKKKKLWESLPKKMMYQTFCVIIDYLSESGKIAIDSEGKIGWTWDPEGVKRYLARKDLRWKSTQK